jgi:RNA polymerase sigma-70 factor (ECF subfamily)
MALFATEPLSTLEPPPSPAPEKESDPRSFAAIYREHSKAIYYLTLRLLGNAQRAEDAVHDVFLKAFRGLERFRDDAQIRTWLYRIAINHCQNLRRSWHQRNIVTTDDAQILEGASTQDSPLRVTEARELGERIQRTLDALPGEYRLILLLVADEALSYEEVAALTQQSADSVRGKLYRARKAFALEFPKTA